VDECLGPLTDRPPFSLTLRLFIRALPSPYCPYIPLPSIPSFCLPCPVSYWQSIPWPIANAAILNYGWKRHFFLSTGWFQSKHISAGLQQQGAVCPARSQVQGILHLSLSSDVKSYWWDSFQPHFHYLWGGGRNRKISCCVCVCVCAPPPPHNFSFSMRSVSYQRKVSDKFPVLTYYLYQWYSIFFFFV
jgi:hypothetical protein